MELNAPHPEEILMICAPSLNLGIHFSVNSTVPNRLIAKVFFNKDILIFSSFHSSSNTAALLISTSILGKFFANASMCSEIARSNLYVRRFLCFIGEYPLVEVPITVQSLSRKILAISRPMPLLIPVMTRVFNFNPLSGAYKIKIIDLLTFCKTQSLC